MNALLPMLSPIAPAAEPPAEAVAEIARLARALRRGEDPAALHDGRAGVDGLSAAWMLAHLDASGRLPLEEALDWLGFRTAVLGRRLGGRPSIFAALKAEGLVARDLAPAEAMPQGALAGASDGFEAVRAIFGVDRETLRGPDRRRGPTRARHVLMWTLRELSGWSLARIGQAVARDHTTVLSGVERLRVALEGDLGLRLSVEAVAEVADRRAVRRRIEALRERRSGEAPRHLAKIVALPQRSVSHRKEAPMTTLLDRLRADALAARKARDPAAGALVTLLGEADARRSGFVPPRDPNDAEVVALIRKFLKGIDETLALLDDARDAAAREKLLRERAALERHLPAEMTEAEIEAFARGRIGAGDGLGQVMAALKAEHAGRFDGRRASEIVKGLLAG